ncbi:MAG: hypothetical protein ACE5DN_06025, partial [Flavobacteriales bacterium]
MELVTVYNPWWLTVCILLGALYAFVLYRRDERFDALSPWIKRAMAVLRFLAVSFLAMLLLNPLLRTISRELEKPLVIIGQDDTESIVKNADSAFYRGQYIRDIHALADALSADYDVKTYTFSSGMSRNFDVSFLGRETDISNFLGEMRTLYENRNVGALILATDGIYNSGTNPLYAEGIPGVKYYTLAMGDTSVKRDLLISRVAHNKMAFLGNRFPLEVVIDASRLKGRKSRLKVLSDGKELFTREVPITSDHFTVKIPVVLEADKRGVRKYTVRMDGVDGEYSYQNNVQQIYIEVLDDRIKVLILSAAPHPDIAALKYAISSHENYKVETALKANFNTSLSAYNLVILHQLPSLADPAQSLLNEIENTAVPVLYVLGRNSDIAQLDRLHTGLKISKSRRRFNEAQAVPEKSFVLFKYSQPVLNAVGSFPPLIVPFGEYALSNDASVLFRQKIGTIEMQSPLVLFRSGHARKGLIAGEGIWKWRLRDFEKNNSHEVFNELIGKMVQYLTQKEDKSRFRVNYKHRYEENQRLLFDAELYDASYAPVNEPEVGLKITDQNGHSYNYNFSRTATAYHLD